MREVLIFGLDNGHGEGEISCIIVTFSDDGRMTFEPVMNLNVKSNESKVYSNVVYDDDGNAIDFGYSLAGGSNVAAYFKKSPKDWDARVEGCSVNKTCKEVMKDFIRCFMRSVRSKDVNPKLPEVSDSDCILYIGCPSDEVWTAPESRAEYEQLVREATGIEDIHVVPESTAAIFSAVSKVKGIDLKSGICVFDIGSLTDDFTYIRLGKVMIEASWTLGASSIEYNIVNKVFENANIRQKNVYHGDDVSRLLSVRRDIKEAWFGSASAKGYSVTKPDGLEQIISYIETDDFGNPEYRINDGGKKVPVHNSVQFTMCKELMDDVINKMEVRNVSEGSKPIPDDSWSGHCRAFFRKCRDLLDNKGYDCKTVILTGGATRMPFITDLCREEFGIEPIRDDSPSYSVSQGLCQVALNDMKISGIKTECEPEFMKSAEENHKKYREDLVTAFSDFAQETFGNVIFDLNKDGVKKITVKELQDKCNEYVKNKLTKQTFSDLIKGPVGNLNENCRKSAVLVSRKVAEQLYSHDYCDNFELNEDIIEDYSSDVIGDERLITIDPKEINISDIMFNIVSLIICCVIALGAAIVVGSATGTGPLGGAFAFAITTEAFDFVGKKVDKFITENPNHNINISSLYKKLTGDGMIAKQIRKNLEESVKKCVSGGLAPKILEKQFGKDSVDYYNSMKTMLADTLDIVALKKFETVIHGVD